MFSPEFCHTGGDVSFAVARPAAVVDIVYLLHQSEISIEVEPIRGQYCHLHQLPVDVLEHEVDLLTVLPGEAFTCRHQQ